MNDQNRAIVVEGAQTHNLRDVDCSVPHGALTVITGVSGSGKSSLAFDTIYAEGQRRYVETLSTYVRQFLQQMPRPPVRAIRHLQPSLALRQGNPINQARSTVGTVTELTDHLQLLFAALGEVICWRCAARVHPWTAAGVVDWLCEHAAGERVVVLADVRPSEGDGMGTLLQQLVADGYRRAWLDGAMIEIDGEAGLPLLDADRVMIVIDRLKVTAGDPRLHEAVEASFARGSRAAIVQLFDRKGDDGEPETRRFESTWTCSACGAEHHEPLPQLLSTESGIGDCEDCRGFGKRQGLDLQRVVPDPDLSLERGAVAAFQTPRMRRHHRDLISAAMRMGIPTDVPWRSLARADRERVFEGAGGYRGVQGVFASLAADRYKPHIAVMINRYSGYVSCATCAGTGLGRLARAVRIDGLHLGQVLDLRIDELAEWLEGLRVDEERRRAVDPLVREIGGRLSFLRRSGASYLTPSRQARTLSGGELHRVLLATSIGRGLTNTCYVLDEPTAGLHAHDTERLIEVIEGLRDLGNTLVVVEHDTDVMRHADHVIELGPEGGDRGGQLLYEGSFAGLLDARTPTGEALRGELAGGAPPRVAQPVVAEGPFLEVLGARLHNLAGLDVRIPHGRLTAVTGVSGSGKSTLVHEVLYRLLMRPVGADDDEGAAPMATLRGADFDEVVLVSQDAIANNSRSCALTLTDAYSPVRELFAGTERARELGLTAGHFSFNTASGRCPRCEGTGTLTVELHFIADVRLTCDVCEGARFQAPVLAATYRGRSIADIFTMTVEEALEFFADQRPVVRRLRPLERVGLGYLRLGQSVTELSGGEKQRLKLAAYLPDAGATGGARRLFLFDEPTVGLHVRDVHVLLRALDGLVMQGDTVVVVEHNLELVRHADWVVDLGPGAGPDGGRLVWSGPVGEMVRGAPAESVTARHLRVAMERTTA